MEAVVKLNSFLLPGLDVRTMREIRQRHFGTHLPASTAVYVPQLVSIDFLLEVEAVAIKFALWKRHPALRSSACGQFSGDRIFAGAPVQAWRGAYHSERAANQPSALWWNVDASSPAGGLWATGRLLS